MLDGFKSGITPNPDVMCNQEIKFKLFYDVARSKGADYIATGHYAKTIDGKLMTAVDDNKDQTYFLYRVSEEALQHTLFPLGDMRKPQVREEAAKRKLITATKKESMGICFVGKVGIREFLSQFVDTEPGPIVDHYGKQIGTHEGAIFYTIGQRHGLDVGGGLPYYVTHKDMESNTVYVTNDISDERLWTDTLMLTSNHWINEPPQFGHPYQVRTRHRAKTVNCEIVAISGGKVEVRLVDNIRASTPGQSAVLYNRDICIGGGIITA
jgi:tRNA-specific 2-thiouridylase